MIIAVNALFLIPGQVGGSETYLRRILSCMARMLDPADELVVFANMENGAVLERDLAGSKQVEIVHTGLRASSRLRRVFYENLKLPRALRSLGASVVWNPGNAAIRHAHCPQVATIYDMQFKRFAEDFPFPALLALRLLVPAAVRKCAAVLTISEFSKNEILHFVPDADPEKIVVTPLAADPIFAAGAALHEDGGGILSSIGLADGERFLLAVSNSYPHKNMETAVRAFGMLARSYPGRLVVLGRPRRGENALQAAIAQLPDPQRVLRIERVDREALATLYATADALVFPSLYEGFGLPVLEAMSAGLPVIASRSGSIPEVGASAVEYALGGDAADFARAIARILDDGRLASEKRQAGIKRAAVFSWEKTAASTLKALRTAAAVVPRR